MFEGFHLGSGYFFLAGMAACAVLVAVLRKFWRWYLGLPLLEQKLEEVYKEMTALREYFKQAQMDIKKYGIKQDQFLKSFEDLGALRKVRSWGGDDL